MRNRILMLCLAGLMLATAVGCNGRFLRRGCTSSTQRDRLDVPPPPDYCPNP
ncbi:MAG: hypothetical protein KF873_22325 [Gemmataceae bacterium]|nr:hypothetical protein [Planctomycetia bacterium]MBX3401479.1 hypothetical protein [Gemmataceae bacterium]